MEQSGTALQLFQMFGSMHLHEVSAEEPQTFHLLGCAVSAQIRIEVKAESVRGTRWS